MLLPSLVLAFSVVSPSSSQNSTPATGVQEFPIVLQENVAAGKTAVGTKVEAKLSIATLVDHTVIPKNAIFSGEVVESAAKTSTTPSRLAIRMDSIRWKDGSMNINTYFSGWYYPAQDQNGGQDLQYGPTQPADRNWNGQGQYPNSSRTYKPFPGSDSDKGSAVPDTPSSVVSKRRALMKDVTTEHNGEGVVALVSKRSTIKLDHYTTYVLSAGDLSPQK